MEFGVPSVSGRGLLLMALSSATCWAMMDQVHNNITNVSHQINRFFHLTPADPTIYYGSYFGSGYGPVAYSYLYCQGWEKDIHDCSKSVYPSFSCPSTYIAGVVCKQGTFVLILLVFFLHQTLFNNASESCH